jgi:hypothetical protein
MGVEPMALVAQIAHLRQLAIDDPDTSLLELTLINALAELADAVQELSAGSPPWNSAGSRSPGGSRPAPCPDTTQGVVSRSVAGARTALEEAKDRGDGAGR